MVYNTIYTILYQTWYMIYDIWYMIYDNNNIYIWVKIKISWKMFLGPFLGRDERGEEWHDFIFIYFFQKPLDWSSQHLESNHQLFEMIWRKRLPDTFAHLPMRPRGKHNRGHTWSPNASPISSVARSAWAQCGSREIMLLDWKWKFHPHIAKRISGWRWMGNYDD